MNSITVCRWRLTTCLDFFGMVVAMVLSLAEPEDNLDAGFQPNFPNYLGS